MTPVDSASIAACPNCGEPLIRKYCPECGQRNDRLRLTTKSLLSEVSDAFIKFDRKFLLTAKTLLIPGQLTIEYLSGRRARYAKPLTLFFICAGLYFLSWSHSGREAAERKSASAGFAAGYAAAFPGENYSPKAKAFMESLERFPSETQSPKGQLGFVFAFGIGLQLVSRKRGFLTSEHFTFVLHLQAFGSLIGAIGQLLVPHLLSYEQAIVAVISVLYDVIAFARVYQFGWWGTIWRFSVALLLTIMILPVLFFIAMGTLWVLT